MKKKFANVRKHKAPAVDVDITSLLDILTILMVFLLNNYNASDLSVDVIEGIKLPPSSSRLMGNQAHIIQINTSNEVWLNNKKMGTVDENKGEKVDFLFIELTTLKEAEKKELLGRLPASEDLTKFENRKVNIICDKKLPYKIIRKIMYTSALAGFDQFKFIVQGNY